MMDVDYVDFTLFGSTDWSLEEEDGHQFLKHLCSNGILLGFPLNGGKSWIHGVPIQVCKIVPHLNAPLCLCSKVWPMGTLVGQIKVVSTWFHSFNYWHQVSYVKGDIWSKDLIFLKETPRKL